jgi:hypothetical protein
VFEHLTSFQTAKLWLSVHTGLAKDSLHIYIGLLVLFGSARLFGWRVGAWQPWLIVAAAALAGEAWDLRDRLVIGATIDFRGNWHDIWNTLFWPSAITLLARGTSLFRK